MLVPAVPLLAPRWVTASLCQAPKEREETLVLRETESPAKMGNRVCQVFRGPLVPKEARENADLQESASQDHKVRKDQEASQDLLDLSVSQEYLALLVLEGKRAPVEMPAFLDHRGQWGWEQQDLRVKMAPRARKEYRGRTAALDLMELRGTRVNLESATA